MKNLLLSLFVLSFGSFIAQNVKDQKVSFNYIQLPSNPINKSVTTYNIVVDNSMFQKANEDSLSAYDARLMVYESAYETWLQEKKKIDKLHLMNMAAWEKATNAGTVGQAMPVKPAYPEQPVKSDVPLAILTEEISQEQADNTINLEGYTKGNDSTGATITLQFLGFQNAKIDVKKSGTGPTTKYTYTSSCKMPVRVILSVPGQGELINEVMFDAPKVETIKSYDNQYEHQIWMIDNYETFWQNKQKAMVNNALNTINNIINDRCGFPKKVRSTEIYVVKKFKSFSYKDLINAYTFAKSGYDLLGQDVDKSKAIKNIKKGIDVWEKALKESDVNNKKSRINDKVTALLYANLAEAYIWMDDYMQADNYIQKAMLSGEGKYKRACKDMQPLLNALKARHEANK